MTNAVRGSALFTKTTIAGMVMVGIAACLAAVAVVERCARACGPAKAEASLPDIANDLEEFYARVDKVNSPTELTVTVLDAWDPMDRLHGPRWPEGKAKVKPAKRTLILEETVAPNAPEHKKAAMDFLEMTLKDFGHEVLCAGSGVSVRKESGGEVICVTGYVYVKKGFTLNNALVIQGLATTTNPFYKAWQEQAKQKKLGMWRDQK